MDPFCRVLSEAFRAQFVTACVSGARMSDVTSTYETLQIRLQRAFDALEVGPTRCCDVSDRSDYQANGVMALAKRLGRPPREVAEDIVRGLDVDDVASVEVAGPGFLNLTLTTAFLNEQLRALTRRRTPRDRPCRRRAVP